MSEAIQFAEQLGTQLRLVCQQLPPRRLEAGEAASVQQFRGIAELAPAFHGGALLVPARNDLSWTVAVERGERFPACPLHRCITICVVDSWEQLQGILQPVEPWLQNAALAVGPASKDELQTTLARQGVSRCCRPGQMGSPSMMWHHDGKACLSSMVKWCDYEDVLPEEVVSAEL